MGFSFGFGLPSALAQLAEATRYDNRAKMGAMITISMLLGNVIAYLMITDDLILNTSILTLWRSLGLTGIIPLWSKKEQNKRSNVAYSRKNVFNYFISWLIFSSINYFGLSISYQIYGYDFVNFSAAFEY
ncbi:MAG: hypothetical protein QXX08_08505, partial [Candidatus Bathyarchaeia archaeon]